MRGDFRFSFSVCTRAHLEQKCEATGNGRGRE